MAVDIPVYVNISEGINQAVREIPAEMPKLERAITKNALKLEFEFDSTGVKRSLQNLITDPAVSMKELRTALANVRKEFEASMQKNAGTKAVKAEINNLIRAYSALEQRITGTRNKFTAASMSTENAIARVNYKIKELKRQLASKAVGSDAWNSLNYQIHTQEDNLKRLNLQLEIYRKKARVVSSSASNSLSKVNGTLRTQLGLFQQLGGVMSGYFSIFGLLRFAKQIRDVTGELEYQRVALGHLIQDEKYGAELFERIKAAAIESPFRITQLVTYTKQLAAYRIEQESLFDTTKRLADISAGLGVDMNRLILAFGQVRAASVLRGQELRQFTEAGIPLVELLAEKMSDLRQETISTTDVFKLISERAVPFAAIADIFDELTDKGGMFYKMQEEQAKTLKGRWEKLKDAYDIALQSIGNTDTFEWWNNKILGILNGIVKAIRVIPKALEGVTRAAIAFWSVSKVMHLLQKKRIAQESVISAKLLLRAVRSKKLTLAEAARIVQERLLTKAEAKLAIATTAVGGAMAKLYITLLKNPWAAAIAGVIGLITAFTTFKKRATEVEYSTRAIEESIEEMAQGNKAHHAIDGLIARYQRLSSKTERTAKENLRLAETISSLKDRLPGLTEEIDLENGSLEENIALLKQKNDEERERLRNEKLEELATYEDTLDAARRKQAAAQAERDEIARHEREARERLKRGAAEINKQFAGTQTKQYTDKELRQDLDYWVGKLSEADDKLSNARKEADAIEKSVGRLRLQLFPEEETKNWEQWRKELNRIQNEKVAAGAAPIFTPDEIQDIKSVYDLFKKLKKVWTDAKESLEGIDAAIENTTDPKSLKRLGEDREAIQAFFDEVEAVRLFFGFDFTKKPKTSYQKDAFITLMEDRMKFMQDFKRGYDDLRQYVGDSAALLNESSIMKARGLSLDINEADQKKAAEELSEWYQSQIDKVLAEMQKKGFKKQTLSEILSQQIVGDSNRAKMMRDYQALLQKLFDAKTDFDVSQQKKNFEDALRRLTNEIKRTETARNFYQNILDLTGDEHLAATMSVDIYGGVGRDFKENLYHQINGLLSDIDTSKMSQELRDAFRNLDFKTILDRLDEIPKEVRGTFEEMAKNSQKFQADQMTSWLKELQKAKTYAEKRVELADKTQKRIAEINASNLEPKQKQTLIAQYAEKEAKDVAKLQYEVFKDSPMYVELFSNLDNASAKMLRNMRANLVALKSQWKDLDPDNLKEMQARLKEVDKQLGRKNPIKALTESLKEYHKLRKSGRTRKDDDVAAAAAANNAREQERILEVRMEAVKSAKKLYGTDSDIYKLNVRLRNEQKKRVKDAHDEEKTTSESAIEWKKIADHVEDASEGIMEFGNDVNKALGGLQKMVDVFATDDVAEYFGIASDGINDLISGTAELGAGLAMFMSGQVGSGLAATLAGIGDIISGTFGATQKANIKRMDKEIERQDRLLSDLEYSYGRVEEAMADAFGSEYIRQYNEEVEKLYAMQAAYEAQAQAEREKDKKADEDKIHDYEAKARETADKITDMQSQVANFFAGTDLTSAAKDFATAWIEAYKQFGSTTDAMKEKFNDMIENMIQQSLGAKIMQTILQHLFDEIDDMAREGDELSAKEIAQIAAEAPEYIKKINLAMTNLMNQMAAAGYNVRQQAGQFTGISRNIANASEESITGLAAGVNTQNFYMQHIDMNVAAILATLTGGASTQGSSVTGEYVDPYKDQMLLYVGSLPQMRDDMAEIRRMLGKVIIPRGTTTEYGVVIR